MDAVNKRFSAQRPTEVTRLRRFAIKLRLARLLVAVFMFLTFAEAVSAFCSLDNNPAPFIRNDVTNNVSTSTSYCELCGYGYVSFVVANPFRTANLTNVQVVVNLGSSGLVYEPTAPNAITYRVNGGPATPGAPPAGAGSVLTFNLPDVAPVNGNSAGTLTVTFAVRRVSSPESLVTANRAFSTTLTYDTNPTDASCAGYGGPYSDSDVLPLREPIPRIVKRGWNYDAGHRQGQQRDPVFGNNGDDIVWRIRIYNNGTADLQDLRFDDLMQTGNMDISYACPTVASANAVAANNGVLPGGSPCVAASNTINNFIVTDPFGQHGTKNYPWGDSVEVDVADGTNTSVYLVGKIKAIVDGDAVDGSCVTRRTNTVNDVQWGCEVQTPAGGISSTSTGVTPGDAATLFTRYMDGRPALQVNRQLTGTNTSQPVGSKGTMTITLTNNSGGSVRFPDALADLRDALPPEYVMDPTYTPTLVMTPRFNISYAGMVDRITWTNPAPGTFPINTGDSTSYLNNTAPQFNLWSSTVHPVYADQRDMMRHGDVLTITFRVVLIESDYYDRVANLDVTPEEYPVTGTDPTFNTPLSNTLTVVFETFCAGQGTQTFTLTGNGTANPTGSNIAADPEDLDVAIGGAVFILTNDPAQQLTLPVLLTNNGGHDARDYHLFVTFGATMEVVSAPAGCSVISPLGGSPPQPDPWKVWVNPPTAIIPTTATVYECDSPAVIAPGQTVTYNFDVIKTADPVRLAIDDLTFRADVVGEIFLSDGINPLWFPAPIPRADGQLDRANNYSLDTVWARVIGFNLKKTQFGQCNENLPPAFDGNGFETVEIGEECGFRIETGGWFGFETPGFAYIAVQNIDVVDEVPDGQAYISSTDPYAESTSRIGINGDMAPPAIPAVTEGWFDWRFNVADANRIEVADEWFIVNTTTRLLNKPVDSRAAPNVHGANSHNVLNSTFDATFQNNNTGAIETYALGPATVGYPNESIRRVDLTVSEPMLTVVKEVCNESLSPTGTGIACTPWVTLANNGDTYDSYIYRITVSNQPASGGLARSPAYDVVVTDRLDASDLVLVAPFDSDGLDNDADTVFDEPGNNEGSISDNVVLNSVPAVITFSHTHSTALQRIDAGASVELFYRVDPDQRIAPQQVLTNTANASYDTLYGSLNESGNQTVDPRPNSDLGGARVYTSADAQAQLEIIPVQTFPKAIVALSETPLGGATQEVKIGEEVEYTLTANLPVARLRSFFIQDFLPAGMSCSEAPVVNLNLPPYNAAGFTRPDGSPVPPITPSCDSDSVIWNFGDVVLTQKPAGSSYFVFEVSFIARVDNAAGNIEAVGLSNGVPATNTTLYYLDELNQQVILDYGQVDAVIREPLVALGKSFAPVINADAADELIVSVTATNNGTANAYNLRILDDLTNRQMTFIQGSVSGADPPDTVDITTFGANQPVFSWLPANPLPPGATRSFTFRVRVETAAQPLEILDNTLQADWTSLPGQSTALNSTGLIGANGSPTGMRIGALPNAGDAINDYEATASASVSVPPLTMSKTDLDPAMLPEIGAHKPFEIVIDLPEGTTNNLVATDNLAVGSVSYVLANNADFDISYIFEGIASINGQPPAEAVFNSFPADGASGSIAWDIGTVVTQTEDDQSVNNIYPRIRIRYHARLNNDLVTDAGDTLQNGLALTYNNGETGATETLNDATALITATESSLTITKGVTVISPLPLIGGSILEYSITAVNNGDATAYDVNLVDTLPPELWFYNSFTPTATINGTAVAGFVATPAGAPAGPLVWGRDNGDASLDIPAGESLVLTYRAQIQEATGVNFNNEVWVDWTSLQDVSTYERNGAGCPSWTAPNDYCAGATSPPQSTTDTTSISKAVIADSYIDPPSTAADAIVRVGDSATYRLVLNLPEGNTRNLVVTDQLPAGLTFTGVLSVNGDTTAPYAAVAPFVHGAIGAPAIVGDATTGTTLTWNLGNIYNTPDGNSSNDTFIIDYQVLVPPDILAHQPTTTLSNTVTLAYTDAAGTPVPFDPARMQAGASLTVWQPVINAISKIDRSGRTSVATVNVATDVMNFRIEACNTSGNAPAYSALLNDVLATQLDETSITGPNNGAGQPDVYINGVLATPVTDYSYTAPAARGGNMGFQLITPINPGQCVRVDYDIGFYTDIGPGETWSNNATLTEYWSLPLSSGQLYGPVGPAIFSMTNGAVTFDPPTKVVDTPASGEVTIGEEIVYHIRVPGNVPNAAMYDVVITDALHPSLEYISATDISGNALAITDNTAGNNVSLAIAYIPAGQQALIALRARVANNADANAGVSFGNTASYTYAVSAGGPTINGGSGSTPGTLTIVEPLLAINKAVANVSNPGNPPIAGDVLRYSVSLPASGGAPGDNFANAYDLSIIDNLSLGLAYQAGTATVDGAGNTIADPVISGDGVSTPQTLNWNPAAATANINVPEGSSVTVTYDVLVLDGVQANQDLVNSATVRWTGIDGDSTYERNGTGTPAVNDYFAGPATITLVTQDNTAILKSRLTDTYNALDANVRIGDLIEYEVRLTLNEGTTSNVIFSDTLPQGLGFEHVVSVNGDTTVPYSAVAPFTHADLPAPAISGDPVTGPSTLSWNIGDIVNAADGNAANNDFVIVYRVRVLDNALPQLASTVLSNNANLQYDTATATFNISSGTSVTLQQPILTVAKSAVTGGGDTVIDAGELVTYTVDITNSGDAPAYDAYLVDTIPQGLRNGAATITMISTTLVNAAVTLPDIAPVYDPVSGVASWNFDTGAADAYSIAVGETLRIVYQVQADAVLGADLTLTNAALVQNYYSFDNNAVPTLGGVDGVREIYGPSNTASVTLTSAGATALDKQATVATATIGEPFTYRILVPAAVQNTALYDVRILDDLTPPASAADMAFVSVAAVGGPYTWTPVNTGSATSLVIEDTVNGIDIPAGTQIELAITVVLTDTSPPNDAGRVFNNTATYTYNRYNDVPASQGNGPGDTSEDMTIVEPDNLTLEKSGPTTPLPIGTPGTFSLNVHNTSSVAAYDATITDLLPNPTPGGMCDAIPTNITAQIYLADGTTTVGAPLVEGTDFSVSFVSGAPTCTLSFTMQTPAAAIPADHRLIINYDATLDLDTPGNTSLTNIAGVTQWFSGDTAGSGATGEIRTYTETITNGTVGTLDHEDAYTVLTEAPTITFQKHVVNATTGLDPGVNASPGDTLRYRIVATNTSSIAVSSLSITDEVDNLNSPALFVPGSLTIISVPSGADTSNTDPNGGSNGTGLLDVRNLSLAAQGNPNDVLTVEFEVTLAPVINNGTLVLNQANLQVYNLALQPSDDPNTPVDDDPTQTLVESNGVIYDSISRQPLAGATVTMTRLGTPLPGSCFDDPAQQNQVTTADGTYEFDMNFSPSGGPCPPDNNYIIEVTAPSGYNSGESLLIPPTNGASTAPYSVPLCTADAVPATTDRCEAQDSDSPPSGTDPTTYYLHLTLADDTPTRVNSQIFNNHIPVDPTIDTALTISKTTPLVTVTRGQMVPYTITLKNTLGGVLQNIQVFDQLPPGFKYVEGSGRLDGNALEPVVTGNGRVLQWDNLNLGYNATHTISLLLVVGSGVGEGEYVNQAWAQNSLLGRTETAAATVRVVPDPTFDCSDIIGKVFDDRNHNGYQDEGETGLGGVRLATAQGLLVTTDKHGRFHVTCAVVPDEQRGSNFILKLDDRTLPSGYRITTENPRVQRVTRGKMVRFNFGAAVHHVVALTVADGVFKPDSTEIRQQWLPRLGLLMEELRKQPSRLRLTYMADVESASLVDKRIAKLKNIILADWKEVSESELTIETEIFWRHGGPVDKNSGLSDFGSAGFSHSNVGEDTEKMLPHGYTYTPWMQDPAQFTTETPETETEQVTEKKYTTRKLTNVVPAIPFGSGKAEIPDEFIAKLRSVMESMRDRENVRLHFIGHTDNARLSGALQQQYVDNFGLSKERAGTTAEFFQRALVLPPEAISYEGMGESKPIASNRTESGKARNRRVEVEVWYDEVSEETVDREVEIDQEIKRVMVCRVETMCKLRYKQGHSRRSRLKNLVPPFHFDEGVSVIPAQYLQQLRQALRNLDGKDNVQMRFIGYTDNMPLSDRDARIYGDHTGLSKANARRVATTVQEALGLPNRAVASTGKGSGYPLASNNSEKGRVLNRRIEVEFWHDDPLEDLPEEAQICPEAAAAETVERIYNPPEGDIKPIFFENGQPVIPAGYTRHLERAMTDLSDKGNVRLRFIGYTGNKRLDRRTAMVYGDDIGLSTARARRAMEAIKAEMNLSEKQAEYEGHGYVQSHDVVNTGFIELDQSKVEVQIVYDELAILDENEGVSIKRITRDVETRDPYALNLMRIVVDGQPLNDPNKGTSDVQRCTDVALDKAQVNFKFDNLQVKPRLNVTAWPNVIRFADSMDTEFMENLTHFKLYTNYPAFITKAEVRLFNAEQSTRDTPIAVVPLSEAGTAQWQVDLDKYSSPRTELKYILRVYDKQGNFDETTEQTLWIVDELEADNSIRDPQKELLVGYGENRLGVNNIPLNGGAVSVYGKDVPKDHNVWFAGHALPVAESGEFGGEYILPSGLHTVEVGITDDAGHGNVYQRDLEMEKSDWFYVGIADLTVARDSTNGPAAEVTGNDQHYNSDFAVDGRLAFYAKGEFANESVLIASADTREGPVDELFSNFMNKSPQALFRRLDPDYFYPTYGDDSTLEEDAPTSGKFYVKWQKDKNYGLWGNFDIAYLDNDLAHVDRGLYGGNLNYESDAATSFGEKRFVANLFAAEPGTVAGRDEFLGTSGSLYYMRRQDILIGSDRLRIEVRNAVSGVVMSVKNLSPGLDYDIDYIQGRIMLREPLSATAASEMLVNSEDFGGNRVYLVANYEYTPGFEDLEDIVTGGRAHYWFGDHVKLGMTLEDQEVTGTETSLNAYDLTFRKNAGTWLKLQQSTSQGPVSSSLLSSDGGYTFNESALAAGTDVKANGQRVDASVRLEDIFAGLNGKITFYNQHLDAGYAAPGLITNTDTTQSGAMLQMPLTDSINIKLKADAIDQENALQTEALELDVDYLLNKNWTLGLGLRQDTRTDDSAVVPLTQQQGDRSDVAMRATYDSGESWQTYGFAQDTISVTGNRDENSRVGIGGDYRLSDRLNLNGELSAGELGPVVKLGSNYKMTDATDIYSSYAFENERTDNGVKARRGNFATGFKTRYSDSASIYMEERYTHGDVPTGLTHALGFDLVANDRLNFGGSIDVGMLRDESTGAETNRTAAGFRIGYKFDDLTYAGALEYRVDETEQPDTSFAERTTWLMKNSIKYLLNPDWRLIGKLNYSQSESSLGDAYNGDFTEAVLGYAYRPVANDKLNALFKYTYFYNLPTTDQLTPNNSAALYIQKSHVLSLDFNYDLTRRWTLGGKYAHRFGQLSLDRENPQFFDSDASLYILRADWHFTRRWDALVEGRMLDVKQAGDTRSGMLLGVYRHLGDNIKMGVGYNFTDFSDDLTDLDYDSQGMFVNVIGKF